MKILIFSLLVIFSCFGVAFADPVTTEASSEIKTHFVDEQIMIMADISNNQDIQQNFAYITQVRDDNDIVISQIGFPSKELYNSRDRNRNFYMLGALGAATQVDPQLARTAQGAVYDARRSLGDRCHLGEATQQHLEPRRGVAHRVKDLVLGQFLPGDAGHPAALAQEALDHERPDDRWHPEVRLHLHLVAHQRSVLRRAEQPARPSAAPARPRSRPAAASPRRD